MEENVRERLIKLPQVGNLLETSKLQELAAETSHALVKFCCSNVISRLRISIVEKNGEAPDQRTIIHSVEKEVEDFLKPRLKRVINATGILLHTGLGRAPLLDEVYLNAFKRTRSSCSLELNLESGKRGDRQDHLEDLLQFVTGATGAAVVNNNAAAVLLALNVLFVKKVILCICLLTHFTLWLEVLAVLYIPKHRQKAGMNLIFSFTRR